MGWHYESADDSPRAAYTVAEGTQVHVDGVTYGAGETVQVQQGTAAQWLAAGWLVDGKTVESKPVRAAKVSRKAS